MRPVIFLDIDGVVVTEASLRAAGPKSADVSCVAHLNEIVEKADAEVVISSSWRIVHSLDFIRGVLCGAGFRWPDRIIDATCRMQYRIEYGVAVGRAERSDEIRAWLEANPRRAFVILDDDVDSEIRGHYVRTSSDAGLSCREASQALSILTADH
jgi:HAD domain in Swiss Army Knife RNA repair proteins